MSELVCGVSGYSASSAGVHVPGATLRRLEDELPEPSVLSKPRSVFRGSDTVQRCITTASICESSESCSAEQPATTESEDGHVAESTDAEQAGFHQVSSHLVIFDYDDTLLPTYALACAQRSNPGHQLVDPELMGEDLDRLTEAILVNFNNVIRVATLVIVTSASSQWLMQSCERYLPRIGEFFSEHEIRIISARDRLDNSLLAQKHWKYFIFIDLVEEHFIEQLKSGEPFTVTSIGDGSEEREACMKLASIFKNQNWIFKNLKLLSQPSVACLLEQHSLLAKSFDSFFKMRTSADLCILFDKKRSKPDN
ncbi:HAD domain ookinete protein, putative [Babesia caballi]|uniref:HAD domain ookinete protein, putative n=1 Tax=Babesia caballi TaxID=5871 RepID=A0AAV4LYC8_BABCB|nr:HAD domain ookinete protein, putative [Babesia caballi]